MGSCISSHTQKPSIPASTAADDIPSSPLKETSVNGVDVLKSQWPAPRSTPGFHHSGSKNEVFFDSRGWLDSDCEDDFFSVNGDFTPSRGSTPVHSSFMGTPRVVKTPTIATDMLPASTPEPSPATKKKKLAELFRESIGHSEELSALLRDNDSKASPEKKTPEPPKSATTTVLDVLPSSEQGSPRISGSNSHSGSERVSNGIHQGNKPDRLMQQRCLPSLRSCRFPSDRKKKMAPAIAVHD